MTGGTAATLTAKQATSTVPIVGISIGRPLETGLVQSLARPGGNVTGISNGGLDTSKWLELLLKIEPTLKRIGFLYNPENAGHVAVLEQFRTSAAASGLETLPAEAVAITDLDVAFRENGLQRR